VRKEKIGFPADGEDLDMIFCGNVK